MRESLLRTRLNDSYDNKWGCFKPNQNRNVDQTPISFVVNTKRTYQEIQKNHRENICISQPGSSINKKRYTVQILTRAEGEPSRIPVIFRITDKSIREDKKVSCLPDVDVYWQSYMWADFEFSVESAKNRLAQSMKDLIALCYCFDNLPAQERHDFRNAVADLNGVVLFGLKNDTDLWQLVYPRLGQMLSCKGSLILAKPKGECRQMVWKQY